jgi:hypothetical protein
LQVSLPRHEWQSTYFLALPYCVGVPLMLVSLALNFLLEESVFFAAITITGWDVIATKTDVVSLRVSLEPMLAVMITALCLCLGTIILGLKCKLKGDGFMPLAASCSLAIAAACHAPSDDTGAHLTTMIWVDIPYESVAAEGEDTNCTTSPETTVHCSFTSREVLPVLAGRIYR